MSRRANDSKSGGDAYHHKRIVTIWGIPFEMLAPDDSSSEEEIDVPDRAFCQRFDVEAAEKKANEEGSPVSTPKAAVDAKEPGTPPHHDSIVVPDKSDEPEMWPSLHDPKPAERGWPLFVWSMRWKFAMKEWFNKIVMGVISINCITMAINSPGLDDESKNVIFHIEWASFIIFVIEMIIKIFAFGLFRFLEEETREPTDNPAASFLATVPGYLNDWWNVLDFLIVMASGLSLNNIGPNITFLRILRVLRPLRLVKRVPELRILTNTLISSMRHLMVVAVLVFMLVVVFTTTGLDLFQGLGHGRCVDGAGNPEEANLGEVCSTGHGMVTCGAGYRCELIAPNPKEGDISFDNFKDAAFIVFWTASLESWTEVLYVYQNAWSPWCIIYFVMITWVITYFGLNLMLAVMSDTYFTEQEDASSVTEEQFHHLFGDESEEAHKAADDILENFEHTLAHEANDAFMQKFPRAPKAYLPLSSEWMVKEGMEPLPELTSVTTRSVLRTRKSKLGAYNFSNDDDGVPKKESKEEVEMKEFVKTELTLREKKTVRKAMRAARAYFLKDREALKANSRLILQAAAQTRQHVLPQIEYLEGKPAFLNELNKLVRSRPFDYIIVACIGLNAVVLSLDHYGISDDFNDALENVNLGMTIVFMIEMVLKILGMGFKGYLSSEWNVFDGSLVLISTLDFAEGVPGVTGLRVFRILRISRVLKRLPSTRILILTTIQCIAGTFWISVLTMFIVFIFSIAGMQFYGESFDNWEQMYPDEERPRFSFENMWYSTLTVFQLLTQDSWPEVKEYMLRAEDWTISIYVVVVVIGGAMIIVNLFLAMLFARFDVDGSSLINLSDMCEVGEKLYGHVSITELMDHMMRRMLDNMEAANNIFKAQLTRHRTKLRLERDGRSAHVHGEVFDEHAEEDAPSSAWRHSVYEIVHENFYFRKFIFLCIGVSTITLIFEDPHGPDREGEDIFVGLDIFFTAVFFIEMALKLVAYGVWDGDHSYLKSGWDTLDGFVVVTSVFSFIPGAKVLKIFRALRPMRVMTHVPQMKLVLTCLVRSVPAIGNLMVLYVTINLMFSILMVPSFKGALYSCSLPEDSNATVVTRADCLSADGEWLNADANFDNVANAMLSLFQVSTMSSWNGIMYACIDSVGIDQAPVRNNDPGWGLFFLFYIYFGGYFAWNMFIAAMVDSFYKIRAELDGSTFLCRNGKRQIRALKCARRMELRQGISTKPDAGIAGFCFRMVGDPLDDNTKFEWAVGLLITVQTAFMMSEHYDQSDEYTDALAILEWIFTSLYTIEGGVKLIAWGWHPYWDNNWNKIDFVVVMFSWIGATGVEGLRLVRLFRVFRLLKFARRSPSLRGLLNTLGQAIHSLWAVSSILFVIMYVYAIVGLYAFGDVKNREDGLGAHSNFRSFEEALMSLWRLTTGDDWEVLMYGAMPPQGDCALLSDTTAGDCGFEWAPAYFVSFIIQALVLVSIMMACILDHHYDESMNQTLILKPLHKWEALYWDRDPKSTGIIRPDQLVELVKLGPHPMGLGYADLSQKVLMECTKIRDRLSLLQVPMYEVDFTWRRLGDFLNEPTIQQDDGTLLEQFFAGDRAVIEKMKRARTRLLLQRAQDKMILDVKSMKGTRGALKGGERGANSRAPESNGPLRPLSRQCSEGNLEKPARSAVFTRYKFKDDRVVITLPAIDFVELMRSVSQGMLGIPTEMRDYAKERPGGGKLSQYNAQDWFLCNRWQHRWSQQIKIRKKKRQLYEREQKKGSEIPSSKNVTEEEKKVPARDDFGGIHASLVPNGNQVHLTHASQTKAEQSSEVDGGGESGGELATLVPNGKNNVHSKGPSQTQGPHSSESSVGGAEQESPEHLLYLKRIISLI